MNTLSRLAVAATAALALAAPTVATVATAGGADAAIAAHVVVAPRAAKHKITLKLSKPGFNTGVSPITVTAKVKGVKKGKMTFSVGSSKKKVKIKKGKAHYTVPASLPPGTYKVVAKFGHSKKKKSFSVWSSKLTLSSTSFALQYDSPNNPTVPGSVIWHGGPATTGWVDFYQNGDITGGENSPYFAAMTPVQSNGTFAENTDDIADYLHDKGLPAGTYSFQAFYTADSAFDDYIYSTPITVTWNPTDYYQF